MTTHELARKLLEGPDLPVVIYGEDASGTYCAEVDDPVLQEKGDHWTEKAKVAAPFVVLTS